jgi:CheY-like chemotaxis protein
VPKKILLVDDLQTVLTLEQMLLGASYEYLTARNGSEAIVQARAGHPDLILLDINMPVMDGIESLRVLKADPKTAAIPIVMVTTRGELQNLERCRSLGSSGFLTKPLNRDSLQALVSQLVGA